MHGSRTLTASAEQMRYDYGATAAQLWCCQGAAAGGLSDPQQLRSTTVSSIVLGDFNGLR